MYKRQIIVRAYNEGVTFRYHFPEMTNGLFLHIVGLSLGGFITADMLAYFPDRMLSAFLASGNIRKSKGPSEPMTKEEAKVRDEEIAALKQKRCV